LVPFDPARVKSFSSKQTSQHTQQIISPKNPDIPTIELDSERNVFLKGINPEWTELDLKEIFSEYGTIVSCKVSCTGGLPKGYVMFSHKYEAKGAIEAGERGDTPCKVEFYKNKKQR
jgi:RNA recognition motif-containing protein